MKKHTLLVTLLSILVLSLAACAGAAAPASDAPAEAEAMPAATGGMEGAELIVAIENAYPPFSYIDEIAAKLSDMTTTSLTRSVAA